VWAQRGAWWCVLVFGAVRWWCAEEAFLPRVLRVFFRASAEAGACCRDRLPESVDTTSERGARDLQAVGYDDEPVHATRSFKREEESIPRKQRVTRTMQLAARWSNGQIQVDCQLRTW